MTNTYTVSKAHRPPVPNAPFGYSVMPRVEHRTAVTGRVTITDNFSSLADWVFLAKEPEIGAGCLKGEGVVRHRDQLLSDDHLVSAVIGEWQGGKTRIVCNADASFTRWYGIEVETGVVNNKLHIIKGQGPTALLDGGIFSATKKYGTVSQTFAVGDEVGVRWDEENSTIRAYVNDVQKTSLPVGRYEIPHGHGYRHWGVAQGVDLFLNIINEGVQFTSITATDYDEGA